MKLKNDAFFTLEVLFSMFVLSLLIALVTSTFALIIPHKDVFKNEEFKEETSSIYAP